MPKWKPTRKLYFSITKGRNRVLTQTEAKGRLVSCGFDIVSVNKLEHTTWIIAKKAHPPTYDMQPTYGALIRLRRVGKDGKLINVLKFRTMHPYSEYLQEDRKSTRLNSSHVAISYAVFCLKKKR